MCIIVIVIIIISIVNTIMFIVIIVIIMIIIIMFVLLNPPLLNLPPFVYSRGRACGDRCGFSSRRWDKAMGELQETWRILTSTLR